MEGKFTTWIGRRPAQPANVTCPRFEVDRLDQLNPFAAARLRSLPDPNPVPTRASFQLSRLVPPPFRQAQAIRRGAAVARHEQGPQGRVEWLPDMDSNHD